MRNGFTTPWHRIEFENTPIYIHPDAPDWFVPNAAADRLLMKVNQDTVPPPELSPLLKRLDSPVAAGYRSRTETLRITELAECWLHITNRCNMACRHCMFTSSPQAREELSEADCINIIREAYGLGCRLFFITGGEPLVSKALFPSLRDIFGYHDTHAVVLTNLTLISKLKDAFAGLPPERLHFQVSLDGLQAAHDAMRGDYAFARLGEDLAVLRQLGFPATLSTAVTRHNVHEMAGVVNYAAGAGVSNLHFLWLFKKGNAAEDDLFAPPDLIFKNLRAAQGKADGRKVRIDNVESLRSQVFSYPGTRFDMSNAGWQSLAVGPDGQIYPTPALVYTEEMACGHLREGISKVWRESPVLEKVRSASLNQSEGFRENPFRYLIGGGDIDHSFIHSASLTGEDPYTPLHNDMARWLIAREAKTYATCDHPAILLKMGEKLGDCPTAGSTVFFTHSNCVLSLPGTDTHTQVNRFYSEAAEDTKNDILNPVCYDTALVTHIPEEMRVRSYGCGSPVMEAELSPGETLADLGSGTGIECFIAARLSGPKGRIFGIDMGDAMLGAAETAGKRVVENLGYDTVEFKKAFLEELPLGDNSVDVVISNCVVNLSPDKRRVFSEIFRVLKPGGRLVISDITHEGNIPVDVKYNEKLRGECIGGALGYHDLFGLLNDIGFSDATVLKGYLYRTVKDHDFYSITYRAVKPAAGKIPELFTFPEFQGLMAEVKSEPTCACFTAPDQEAPSAAPETDPHRSGCMVCGGELVYFKTNRTETCHFCGLDIPANAACAGGHFVCDTCHAAGSVALLKQVCLNSREKDAVALMQHIRAHPRFPIHGPEHHALVPAVILTALRNSGNDISDGQILTAIERGQTIAGGACAFFGACGAAMGAGIAMSLLMGATPLDGEKRKFVQQATHSVLGEIAAWDAARCCQRDGWLALRAVSKLLAQKMGMSLTTEAGIVCRQFGENKECIHGRCPLWPGKRSEQRSG
jgi:MoaA/NifB/PqqE/SkfB family radical SAM enzyme/ubiquinone/menaquinone biosynthesis C-methylase UbiE